MPTQVLTDIILKAEEIVKREKELNQVSKKEYTDVYLTQEKFIESILKRLTD